MARAKRIWRESQHPRDAKGRFSRRGGVAWIKRAAAELTSAADAGSTRSASGRPQISRSAKAGVVLQAHADGGRPSAVRVPKAVKTSGPTVNTARFMAPDAPAAPAAPKKRTPRPAPGAAAFRAQRAEEQAPQQAAMVAARTAPESAPVPGAADYASMRQHTLVSLARQAGVPHRNRSRTDIANDLAARDAQVKADRKAKLNPSDVGTDSRTPEKLQGHADRLEAEAAEARAAGRMQEAWDKSGRAEKFRRSAEAARAVDTPRVTSDNGGMTSTTADEPRNLVTMARTLDLAMPQGATAIDHARAADRLARDGKLDAAEVELQNGTRSAGITPADAKALNGILQALKDVRAGRQTAPAGQDRKTDAPAPPAAKAPPGADTEHLKRPKAKKGDLVVVEETSSSYVIGKGSEESTTVRVGVVTSTDRDGRVTGWSPNADGSYPRKVDHRQKTYKLEAERVDVAAAIEAAAANPWPHKPEAKGKPFTSIAEARAAVAPHLGDQTAKLKAARAESRGAASRRPASEAKVTEAATAMRQEKDYAKALRLIDEGEVADPGYKDKQGRGWSDFRTFVTARRDQVAKQEAERKAEEAGPRESAADLAIGRDLYQRFASPDRTPFDYAPSHAERDRAEQAARDEVASLLPSGAMLDRTTLANRLARAEGAVAAFSHQREAKRAEVVQARELIAKIEDPEYRKLQEKEILRRLEFEEETLISAIHRQETDVAAARADLEKALGRGADREKLIARRRDEAEDRARNIANEGGRSYGDSGAGARVIAKFGTRPTGEELKAMSQRDREHAQNEMIMRGSHQDDLSKVVRSGLRNVDTNALTPEQRQAWIDATDAPSRALVHTMAARQRRDLALSRLAALEAHQDRPSDAPELRAELDKAIAQERANLDSAQGELSALEPEYQANLDRVQAAVNAVRATAGLKPTKLNTKTIDAAYAKRIASAGITPQPNPPAPPTPEKPKTKLVFAEALRTPTTGRKQIPRDTKVRAIENQRDGGRGVVARHRDLTREQFDALPEAERNHVLQDLRQVARSTEEESYTTPSNRSSMGMTVRGMREAAHVTAAKAKIRDLTYTAPPPVDNSISGRAARLRAGDTGAIYNATIAELNEAAREAGLSGGNTGWPRTKLADYIRDQVAAGADRMRAGREGNLADALRGATPGQALAVLDALEADGMGQTTVAKLKAAAKALGIKATGTDKRMIRNALAKGAADAPSAPAAKADPPAAPKVEAPERSEAEIDAFIRSKGLYPDEFEGGVAEKRKWVKDYEAQFGPTKAPNEVSADIKKLELRIRGIELARESATLYGDSSGLDEDEEGRAKVAARKELADLKAKLIDLQRAERGYDSTPSKAFAKVSDYDLERAIKGAIPGTKKRAALVAERDARAAARFKAARPKADAAQVAAPARARITPDAKRGALARLDTSRVKSQNGGMTPIDETGQADFAEMRNDNLGIARKDMPQITGNPQPGSPGAAHANERGFADLRGEFERQLTADGVRLTRERVPASSLRPVQNEMNDTKIGGLVDAVRSGNPEAVTSMGKPIYVSRDGRVIDGHHKWAAAVQLGEPINVVRLDMDIKEALDYARKFGDRMGIGRRDVTEMAGAGTGEPVPSTLAGGTVQRAERTTRKAELRAMSDADLQAAYRKAGALEAKELRAEISRRENLVKPEPHHPALTGDDPMIPAGANRIEMNIVDLDEETGRTIGHLFLPGYAPGDSDSDLRIHQDRGGPWIADELPGDMPDQSARNPHELMAKVARLYGITGTGQVDDERDNARTNWSGIRPLPAAAPAAPAGPKRGSIEARIAAKEKEIERRVGAVSLAREARSNTGARIQSTRESMANTALSKARRELAALQEEQRRPPVPVSTGVPESVNADGTITVGGLLENQRWVNARGGIVHNPSQTQIIRGEVKLRTIPTAPAGVGPGNVPVGGTDADRRAARPRIEGESDRAYEIRTAPSRFAAESLLKGNTLGGLRAFARAEGVVTTSSDTKAGLVERLMRALYDRHADSEAITRMVNRDRTPAPAAPAAAPRSNTPPASGPITPTMTGSQLLAQRRAARPKA